MPKPTIQYEDEISDAKGMHKAGVKLYVKYNANTNRYSLHSLEKAIGGHVWDYLYRIDIFQARTIVRNGWAEWDNVDPSKR